MIMITIVIIMYLDDQPFMLKAWSIGFQDIQEYLLNVETIEIIKWTNKLTLIFFFGIHKTTFSLNCVGWNYLSLDVMELELE